MARTRKSIQPLNLYKYDVLIEDQGPRSDYFKITQFDGYFYGGRNAFLVAGAGVLHPGSKILVEILNKNGTTIYSAPITKFVEGNSRMVQVEVYSDTPIGPGKIVLLGYADKYIDGRPIPEEWRDKYNVRWVTDVVISPLVYNKTPIRFETSPSVVVEEKFYNVPSSSLFTENVNVPIDIELTPKYYNVFPNGYQIRLKGPGSTRYFSEYVGGTVSGSVYITADGSTETASISLPITRIYNSTLAESTGKLIYTDKQTLILDGFISSSGSYTTTLSPFGSTTVTGSINLVYNKLETFSTGSDTSFAKLRIVDAKTLSGEINKVRVSYKSSTQPGEYVTLSDVNIGVVELFAVDSGSNIAETGRFKSVNINDYWYAATMSVERGDSTPTIPNYYISSSQISNQTLINQCCVDLLDSINATPTISASTYINNVSSFIGNRINNSLTLFPRSEYTVAFDAVVTKVSASVGLDQADYGMEVFLVQQENSDAKLLETNPRGQLLGKLTPQPNFQKQNFERVEFNFSPRIIQSGKFGLRFVFYGGFWNIANVSVKTAQEPFFSPDEVDILIPIIDFGNDILEFRTEYLDINNNTAGVSTFSIPLYVTGSQRYVKRSGDTMSGPLYVNGIVSATEFVGIVTSASYAPTFPYTGSAMITGSLGVTGSLTITGSGTLINIGPARFTGSLGVTGGITGSLLGTASTASFVTPSGLPTGIVSSSTQLPTGVVSSSTQLPSGIMSSSTQTVTNLTNQNITLAVVSASQLQVQGNLTVLGSSSVQYVTSSQLNIGTNIITVNTQNPAPRFGGLAVVDSGSSPQRSGSLLFDSLNDQWIFVHQNQTSPTSSVLIMGPETYNNIGNETNLTTYYLPKSVNAEHLGDSQIYDNGTNVGIGTTSPDTNLSILRTSGGRLPSTGTTPTNAALRIKASANNAMYMGVDTGSPYGGWIQVADVTGLNATYPILLNPNGGNVGIGTASPGATLHVQGNVSASSYTGSFSGSLTGTFAYASLTGLPTLVSSSGQIDHNSTTNYSANRHIDHTTVSISTSTGLTGGGDISSTRTLALTGQALSFHNLSSNGLVARTTTDTVAARSIAVSGTGLSISNADGVSGNPTITIGGGLYSSSAQITSLGASVLTGTIPSSVLGNSTLYVGTTAIALNRSSASQTLTGVGIDGNAGTVTNGVYTNGSYADPTWITSLAGSKISGNITGNAANITAYTINQNVGTSNSPSFAGLTVNGSISQVGATNFYRGSVGASANSVFQSDNGNGTAFWISGKAGALHLGGNGGSEPTGVVVIDYLGNVGIGTVSPSNKLDVIGNVLVQGTQGFNATNETATIYIGDSASYIQAVYDGGLDFYQNSVQRVRIQGSTGNVGIGTTSPSTKLHLSGGDLRIENATAIIQTVSTTGTNAVYQYYSNTGGSLYIGKENSAGSLFGVDAYASIIETTDAYPLVFLTNATEKMRITSAGRVGIGITSPATPLDVNGGAAGTGGWNRTATLTATFPTLIFNSNGTKWGGIAYDYSAAMRFWVNASNNDIYATTAIMSITNAGNVGIGLTNPSYKLDVTGTVNATGVIYGNGKEIFNTGDSYLRINSIGGFSSGIWMANSNMAAGTSYWSLGSNGGTTNSRIYMYGGTYDGNNVIYVDGNTGVIKSQALIDGGSSRIVNPSGAYYQTGASTVTGAWKIKLPTAKNNSSTMLRMTIKLYQYTTGQSITWDVGGYNYSGGNWYNIFAWQTSDTINSAYTVRFGYDGTGDCIWIGETNSSWSYPQIMVTDVQIGYSGYDAAWATGWTLTNVTSFDTVEQSRTSSVIWGSNNDGTGSGLDADLWDGYQFSDYLNQAVKTNSKPQFDGLGVGTAASSTAGEIRATNEITAYYSDARLKNFHGTIQEAISKVETLHGYYFTENEVAKSLGYTNDKMQIGVSAQEVQAVLPEAVVPAPIDDKYLTVKYEKLVPVLIEAIKEQQTLIRQLQDRIDGLYKI